MVGAALVARAVCKFPTSFALILLIRIEICFILPIVPIVLHDLPHFLQRHLLSSGRASWRQRRAPDLLMTRRILHNLQLPHLRGEVVQFVGSWQVVLVDASF